MWCPLHRRLARTFLWLRTAPFVFVMCRGYNEEDDVFTELVWEDDRDLEFRNKDSYPEFQLWIFPRFLAHYFRNLLNLD